MPCQGAFGPSDPHCPSDLPVIETSPLLKLEHMPKTRLTTGLGAGDTGRQADERPGAISMCGLPAQ